MTPKPQAEETLKECPRNPKCKYKGAGPCGICYNRRPSPGETGDDGEEKGLLDAIPLNWCDPLLSGPDAVIGTYPYGERDIENLLNGIRERIKERFAKPTAQKRLDKEHHD